MKLRLQRIPPLKLAIIVGSMLLIIVFLYSLIASIALLLEHFTVETSMVSSREDFGHILLIILGGPIIYALKGALIGFFCAILYNLVARYIGGLVLECSIEEDEVEAPHTCED